MNVMIFFIYVLVFWFFSVFFGGGEGAFDFWAVLGRFGLWFFRFLWGCFGFWTVWGLSFGFGFGFGLVLVWFWFLEEGWVFWVFVFFWGGMVGSFGFVF